MPSKYQDKSPKRITIINGAKQQHVFFANNYFPDWINYYQNRQTHHLPFYLSWVQQYEIMYPYIKQNLSQQNPFLFHPMSSIDKKKQIEFLLNLHLTQNKIVIIQLHHCFLNRSCRISRGFCETGLSVKQSLWDLRCLYSYRRMHL